MLVAALFALAPKPITFSAPAAPASRLIPEIGRTLGLKLEVSPNLAREVLLVRAKGVAPEDIFRRLAQVTGGEWSLKEGVYRLALVSGVDARQRRTEAIARGRRVWSTAQENGEMRKRGQTPLDTTGAIDAVLLSLSPETLGGWVPRERVVFSTRPTAMQRAIPQGALSGVSLSGIPRSEPFRLGDAPPAVPGPVAIVQVAIQPDTEDRNLLATLIAADAKGVTVGGTMTQYRMEDDSAEPPGGWAVLPQASVALKIADEDRKRCAALSTIGASALAFGGPSWDESPVMLYSDDELSQAPTIGLLPEILKPETREPLDLVVTPLLASLAESQGANLVASIPDEAFAGAADLLAGHGTNAATVVRESWRTMGVSIVNDAGWVVVLPRRPAAARAARLDRATLGTALRTLAKDGNLNLDARAAYAAAQPLVPARETFEAQVFAAVNIDAGKRMLHSAGNGERTLLRLYRALGSVRTNDPVSYGSLPTPVRTLLADLIYNGYNGPNRSIRYTARNSVGDLFYPGGPYSIPPSLEFERTVYWPRGIPTDARFTREDREEQALFGMAPNGTAIRMIQGKSGYGMRGTANGTMITSTSLPLLARYARGTGRLFGISLSGDPMVAFSRSLEGGAPDPRSPILGFDDLPEGLRKSIEGNEAGIRRMREENENYRNGPRALPGVQ